MSEARYFRFWRGEKNQNISYEQFLQGLNSIFVPATGALALSSAQLRSYQPVLISMQTQKDFELPHEIALVEYASEKSYQDFRATDAGRKYAALHWDYFDRERSGSAVTADYKQNLEFNKAYILTNKVDFDVNIAHSFIKVYVKENGISDPRWLDSITAHVERQSSRRPEALVFLVSEKYLLEYSLWSTAGDVFDPEFEVSSQLVLNSRLEAGRTLAPDSGIKFKQ